MYRLSSSLIFGIDCGLDLGIVQFGYRLTARLSGRAHQNISDSVNRAAKGDRPLRAVGAVLSGLEGRI